MGITLNDAVAQAMAAGTDAQIRAQRERLDGLLSILGVVWAVCCLTFIVGAVCVFVPAKPAAELAFAIAFAISFVCFFVCQLFAPPLNARWRELTPLSESDSCPEALELVEQSAAASALRDRVLESGRRLYLLDFKLMQQLAKAERVRERSARAPDACARLHRIAR